MCPHYILFHRLIQIRNLKTVQNREVSLLQRCPLREVPQGRIQGGGLWGCNPPFFARRSAADRLINLHARAHTGSFSSSTMSSKKRLLTVSAKGCVKLTSLLKRYFGISFPQPPLYKNPASAPVPLYLYTPENSSADLTLY